MSEEIRITLIFEGREDGGLRVWSPELPGLVLSHREPILVIADIFPALAQRFGMSYRKAKFGYVNDRITFLEGQAIGLQTAVKQLRAKHTAQCLDINSAAGKIKTLEENIAIAFGRIIALEQREAKREEAFRSQEDAYEERMRATMSQDWDENASNTTVKGGKS